VINITLKTLFFSPRSRGLLAIRQGLPARGGSKPSQSIGMILSFLYLEFITGARCELSTYEPNKDSVTSHG
jgi:hypothetical protein